MKAVWPESGIAADIPRIPLRYMAQASLSTRAMPVKTVSPSPGYAVCEFVKSWQFRQS
jgi:hypothetical protein